MLNFFDQHPSRLEVTRSRISEVMSLQRLAFLFANQTHPFTVDCKIMREKTFKYLKFELYTLSGQYRATVLSFFLQYNRIQLFSKAQLSSFSSIICIQLAQMIKDKEKLPVIFSQALIENYLTPCDHSLRKLVDSFQSQPQFYYGCCLSCLIPAEQNKLEARYKTNLVLAHLNKLKSMRLKWFQILSQTLKAAPKLVSAIQLKGWLKLLKHQSLGNSLPVYSALVQNQQQIPALLAMQNINYQLRRPSQLLGLLDKTLAQMTIFNIKMMIQTHLNQDAFINIDRIDLEYVTYQPQDQQIKYQLPQQIIISSSPLGFLLKKFREDHVKAIHILAQLASKGVGFQLILACQGLLFHILNQGLRKQLHQSKLKLLSNLLSNNKLLIILASEFIFERQGGQNLQTQLKRRIVEGSLWKVVLTHSVAEQKLRTVSNNYLKRFVYSFNKYSSMANLMDNKQFQTVVVAIKNYNNLESLFIAAVCWHSAKVFDKLQTFRQNFNSWNKISTLDIVERLFLFLQQLRARVTSGEMVCDRTLYRVCLQMGKFLQSVRQIDCILIA